MRRGLQLLVLFCSLAFLMGADSTAARYEKLGSKIMCTCGCGQMLLKCNHVGCPNSAKMISQLHGQVGGDGSAGVGGSDEDVLNFFRREWGVTSVVEPSQHGFELIAWILPFAGLGVGLCLVIVVVRKWRVQPAEVKSANVQLDSHLEELRERARRETEI